MGLMKRPSRLPTSPPTARPPAIASRCAAGPRKSPTSSPSGDRLDDGPLRRLVSGPLRSLIGEAVHPLVLRVACVALHPARLHLMPRQLRVEGLPEVYVQHGLAIGLLPAPPLPVLQPGRDALHHVLAVALQ